MLLCCSFSVAFLWQCNAPTSLHPPHSWVSRPLDPRWKSQICIFFVGGPCLSTGALPDLVVHFCECPEPLDPPLDPDSTTPAWGAAVIGAAPCCHHGSSRPFSARLWLAASRPMNDEDGSHRDAAVGGWRSHCGNWDDSHCASVKVWGREAGSHHRAEVLSSSLWEVGCFTLWWCSHCGDGWGSGCDGHAWRAVCCDAILTDSHLNRALYSSVISS